MKPNFPLLLGSSRARILSFTCVALLALVLLFRSAPPEASPTRPALFVRPPSSSPGSIAHLRPAILPAPLVLAADPPAAANGTGAEWQDAFATAAAISDSARREEALVRLCYERAGSDPRTALELAIGYRLEEAPGGVIGNLAQQWAAADLPAARAWVELQPPGETRDDLITRIGYLWSLDDPAAAAVFVTAETTPGDAQIEAAISVLHQWKDRDPAAARAWAECFPEGPERQRALQELVDHPGAAE